MCGWGWWRMVNEKHVAASLNWITSTSKSKASLFFPEMFDSDQREFKGKQRDIKRLTKRNHSKMFRSFNSSWMLRLTWGPKRVKHNNRFSFENVKFYSLRSNSLDVLVSVLCAPGFVMFVNAEIRFYSTLEWNGNHGIQYTWTEDTFVITCGNHWLEIDMCLKWSFCIRVCGWIWIFGAVNIAKVQLCRARESDSFSVPYTSQGISPFR